LHPFTPAAGAAAASASGPVVGVIDPEEPEATQKLRANVHSIRVRLIRAASRLGYAHDNGLVKQVSMLLYVFVVAQVARLMCNAAPKQA
jgi:hypothetical protein